MHTESVPKARMTRTDSGPSLDMQLPVQRMCCRRLGPPGPGVFMQGNLVFNAKQELIYRRDLERSVVETAIDFAAEHGKPSSRESLSPW